MNQKENLINKILSSRKVSGDVLFEGAELCFKKAEDLVDLAMVAHEKDKWGPSASLSVLAMEEIAKGEVMQHMVLSNNHWEWYSFWSLFSGKGSHLQKLEHFKGFEEWFKDLQSMIEGRLHRKKFAGENNALKLKGFYINFDKQTGRFTDAKITKKQSSDSIKRVENSLTRIKPIRDLGYKELLNIMKIVKGRLPSRINQIILDKVHAQRMVGRGELANP